VGRANLVLNVYVHARWLQHEAIDELRGQGHRVNDGAGGAPLVLTDVDIFIHPACGWTDEMLALGVNSAGETTDKRPYLEVAKSGARKRRKDLM